MRPSPRWMLTRPNSPSAAAASHQRSSLESSVVRLYHARWPMHACSRPEGDTATQHAKLLCPGISPEVAPLESGVLPIRCSARMNPYPFA
eukprot:1607548-Prymnesium_polylepis.1